MACAVLGAVVGVCELIRVRDHISAADASVAAASIAALVAWLTYREGRENRFALSRAYLFPHFERRNGQWIFIIANSGNGHAVDIQLTIDPELEEIVGRPRPDHFRWSRPIPFLPGHGSVSMLMRPPKVHVMNGKSDPTIKIEMSYVDGLSNRSVTSTFILNFDHYQYGEITTEGGDHYRIGLVVDPPFVPRDPGYPPSAGSYDGPDI